MGLGRSGDKKKMKGLFLKKRLMFRIGLVLEVHPGHHKESRPLQNIKNKVLTRCGVARL